MIERGVFDTGQQKSGGFIYQFCRAIICLKARIKEKVLYFKRMICYPYPEYRKAQDEMQEIVKAQKNVELLFAEEKDDKEKEQTR